MGKATMWLACLVIAAGCQVGPGPGNGTAGTAGEEGSCQGCTLLGQSGMCLAKDSATARAAIADPATGSAVLASEANCTAAGEVCVPQTVASASCSGGNQTISCETPITNAFDVSQFPACAPDASCVHQQLIATAGGGPELVALLAPCEQVPGAYCVPNNLITSAGTLIPVSCNSTANAEGRCLSKALPDVSAFGELLPTAGCGANEACAPCFNPVDGQSTGACDLPCDSGATQAPVIFANCENAGGKCVPNTSLTPDLLNTLAERDCGGIVGPNHSCVPNQNLQNGPFELCRGNGGGLFGVDVDLGTCLNTDILDISGSGFLPEGNVLQPVEGQPGTYVESNTGCRDAFGPGFNCVPCERNGEVTGAPGCPANLNIVIL